MKRIWAFACLALTCAAMMEVLRPASHQMTRTSMPYWLAAQNLVKELRIASENFHLEYQRFPGQAHQSQLADLRIETTGAIIDSLLGENTDWNERQIKFVDLPTARNGRGGYIPAEGNSISRLVDPWATPYVILLDTSGDNAIENPDVKNADPQLSGKAGDPPPRTLPFQVAVFSFGQDRVEGTGDDIASWRGVNTGAYGSSYDYGWTWFKVPIGVAMVICGVGVYCLLRCAVRKRQAQADAAPL